MDGNTTGAQNTAVGKAALGNSSTASYHTAIGAYTLDAVTTAVQNTALGWGAGSAVTTGNNNVLLGYGAGDAITTGTPNVAVGTGAYGAGNGAENVSVGTSSHASATTGNYNTGVGSGAGYYITTGTYNVSLGRAANQETSTGSFNICIGASARPSGAGGSSETVFGYNVQGQGGSTFTFGSGSTFTSVGFGNTNWGGTSDARLKEFVQDETVGLSFVNELRPVTFQWKKKKELPEDFDLYEADSDERVMNGKYNHGFIAQEVKSVIDKYSDIKDGFDFWSKSSDGMERVAPSALMSIMVKAVQELSAENKALSDRLTTLENK